MRCIELWNKQSSFFIGQHPTISSTSEKNITIFQRLQLFTASVSSVITTFSHSMMTAYQSKWRNPHAHIIKNIVDVLTIKFTSEIIGHVTRSINWPSYNSTTGRYSANFMQGHPIKGHKWSRIISWIAMGEPSDICRLRLNKWVSYGKESIFTVWEKN